MKKILTLTFILMSSSLFGEEVIRFESLLTKLNEVSVETFVKKIDKVKGEFDRYFTNKSRICQGEFSTIVLGETPSEESESTKLSKSEIKACLSNLANERMVYIDAIYKQRENYLKFLHKKQLEQLAKSKEAEAVRWQKLKTQK